MNAYRQYWTFSSIRGVMTMMASLFILAVPYATSSMLSLPVLVMLAVDCWATYSVLDSGVMVLLEKLLPARAGGRKVLYAQAGMNLVTGGLLYLVGFEVLAPAWVMWIASAQAGFAAYAEWRVARDTHRQYGCMSCYATPLVLLAATVGLPFAIGLDAGGTSLAIATYVGLYGFTELALGGRMLFAEYRAGHPAAVASVAWRGAMEPAVGRECAGCAAEATCADFSRAGQVGRVLGARVPAIVRGVQLAAVLAGR